MKKHTQTYMKYFGYGIDDFIGCEVCGNKAVDIHHIDARGMGSSKDKDTIQNIMAMCRICHERYGDKKEHTEWLKQQHELFIERYGKVYY